jgi:hypothetical protein
VTHVTKKLSAARRNKLKARAAVLIAEQLPLQELRRARLSDSVRTSELPGPSPSASRCVRLIPRRAQATLRWN